MAELDVAERGGLVARVARDPAEIADLREVWKQLPVSYVDAELDYFLAFVGNHPGNVRPYVIRLDDADGPRGLVVAYIEEAPFPCKFGYRTIYKPTLRTLRVAHGGLSGIADPVVAGSVVEMLDEALARGEADALVVPAVRLGTPLHKALGMRPSWLGLRRQRFADAATHRRMAVPATFEELLAARDSKARYNLRRSASQLHEAFGEALRVEVLSAEGDFERIFVDLERIASKTYQRGLGAGFADTPQRRAQVLVALRRGWLRAWLMTIEARPVAFWLGNQLGDTFYVGSTAYDPEYARRGVGTVLQMRMFEDLCSDTTVSFVDFGWGDAEYKARFGTESWEEQDVVVMAPSLRGLRVNTIRAAIVAADRASRRVLAATGMTQRLKRIWRGRIRPTAASDPPSSGSGG